MRVLTRARSHSPAEVASEGQRCPCLAHRPCKLSLLLFLVFLFQTTGCTQKPATTPVRLGQLAGLSGPEKLSGDHARWGVQLALPAPGSDEPAPARPLVVHHVDHQGDSALLQAETVRLLAVNRCSALIVSCDAPMGDLAARAAQPYDVPLVLTGELTAVPRAGVVTLGAGPGPRGRALACLARQELKATRAAILLGGERTLPAAMAEAFRREWSLNSTNPVETWSWDGKTDLGDLSKRVARWKPDVILAAGSVADFVKVRQELETASLKVPLLFAGEDSGPEAFRGDVYPAGIYLATVFSPGGLTEPGKDIARRYREEFQEPLDLAAAQSYDALRLVGEVLAASRAPGAKRPHEELARLETFESLTGPIKFKDRRTRRPVFLLRIKEGQPALVRTWTPEDE